MAVSYTDLTKLSDEELIERIDRAAQNMQPGLNFYLEELRHRREMLVSQDLHRLTRRILGLTGRIRCLTFALVLIALVQIAVTVVLSLTS